MKRFVLDCCLAISWGLQDENLRYPQEVLRYLSSDENVTAVVPIMWSFEMSNVILVNERRKRLSQEDLSEFLFVLSTLNIEVDKEDPGLVFLEGVHLGRTYGLSSYDASYIALAIRENLPLATIDGQLAEAALKAGVLAFQP